MIRLSNLRTLQPLPGVALAVVTAIIAYAVRYSFIEPEQLGAACEKSGPWWCGPRTAFIVFTEWNGFGWASLALAALAAVWMARRRDPARLALAALAIGGAGLVLYNATLSTVAVVAAVLLLAQPRLEAP
ncbi:MAG TPA: hypothetical protein VF987_08775 [Rhodospirillales bacterium]|jgi:hypothetical protein